MAEQNFTPDELKKEEWRDVVGYEGIYSISNLGRLRSHTRKIRCRSNATRVVAGKILSLPKDKNGYCINVLHKEGHGTNVKIHTLVAEAFIGPRLPGLQINHLNGDKADNRPENIEYVTCLENIRHAIKVLGVDPSSPCPGEKNGNAKLTEEEVKEIRALYATGEYFQRELAEQFNVSQTLISHIVIRRAWKHI